MRIRAAVLRSNTAPFSVEELELEDPRSDEVLVRMVSVGMCHTDVLPRALPPEYFQGPSVFGHEGAAVVERVGSAVTKVAPGDHVVLSFRHCGDCRACKQGRPAYCLNFVAFNTTARRPDDATTALRDTSGAEIGSHYFGQSSFSSYAVVAQASVVPVDKSYDLKRLGPLGCGVQTGAGAIFNIFKVKEGDSVVVAGAGALGLSAVMAAKVAGAGQIIATDLHDNRLILAEKYGATATIRGDVTDLTTLIREATGGGADYALDTTGNAAVVRSLHDGLHGIGHLALCGAGFGDVALDFVSLLSGRVVLANIEGDSRPDEFIPYLARLNNEGSFPFDELITEFALEDINDAEAASAAGNVVKPLIVF